MRDIPITRISKQVNVLKGVRAAAKADVCRLAPDGYTCRLAMTSAAPYLTEGHEEDFVECIAEFIKLARSTKPDAMAWVFPAFKELPSQEVGESGSFALNQRGKAR